MTQSNTMNMTQLIYAALDNERASNFIDIEEIKHDSILNQDGEFEGSIKLVRIESEFYIISNADDDVCEQVEGDEESATAEFDKQTEEMKIFKRGEL